LRTGGGCCNAFASAAEAEPERGLICGAAMGHGAALLLLVQRMSSMRLVRCGGSWPVSVRLSVLVLLLAWLCLCVCLFVCVCLRLWSGVGRRQGQKRGCTAGPAGASGKAGAQRASEWLVRVESHTRHSPSGTNFDWPAAIACLYSRRRSSRTPHRLIRCVSLSIHP